MKCHAILGGMFILLRLVLALSLFESLPEIPREWIRLDRPSPSTFIYLRIALKQPNHHLFEQALLEISNPYHSRYGQHLKREEISALIQPSDESTETVLSWLLESGVAFSNIENKGEWINFYASIAVAEAMMDTDFYFYSKDSDVASKKIITLQYSVPYNVSYHIDMIQPTTRFGNMRTQRQGLFRVETLDNAGQLPAASSVSDATGNAKACNINITPGCLRDLYNIGDYEADPRFQSLFGVCGYLKEYAKYDALDLFLEEHAPYASGQNFSYVLVNGGLALQNDTVDDDLEANLDVQYTASLAVNTKIHYYSTGGLGYLVPDFDEPLPADNANEPYLDFLSYILKVPDDELPQTITTSYGEDEQSVPEAYSRIVCNMFGQLGLRGVSVIFSSGDTGVGSSCKSNDGKNTTKFTPMFPAACPYVTSVGATFSSAPEQSVYFSSGGFSDRFARPEYQEAAVKSYLGILGDRWKGLYNPTGRGFPDVAAQGWQFQYVDQNKSTLQLGDVLGSGTSAAAPTFASIIALLNNARQAASQPPLGFLNPWLYSIGKNGLTDIITGGSQGCTGTDIYSGLPTPYVPYASWNATLGWDPVSGLGTPDFKKLLALVLPFKA